MNKHNSLKIIIILFSIAVMVLFLFDYFSQIKSFMLNRDDIASLSNQVFDISILLAIRFCLLIIGVMVFLFYDAKKYKAVFLSDIKEMKAISSNISGGICKCSADATWSIAHINTGFSRLFGYEKKEILEAIDGKYRNLILEEDRHRVEEMFQAPFCPNQNIEVEYRAKTKQGKIIWILEKTNFILDEKGKQWYYCILMDITHSKDIEHRLRINERKYQIALEQSDHVFFDYDIEKDIIKIPKIYAEKNNYPQTIRSLPQFLWEHGIINKENKKELLGLGKSIVLGEASVSCEIQLHEADKAVWKRVTLINLSEGQEGEQSAIGILEDITEQKSARLSCLREQKYREVLFADSDDTYQINFSENKILSGNEDWFNRYRIAFSDNYEKMLKKLAEKEIYEEDAAMFLDKFSLSNIFNSFKEGLTKITVEYRQKSDDAYIWMQGDIFLVEDLLTENLTGFIQVRNIDSKKKEELNWRFQAERDQLSGLYNKGATEYMITRFLKVKGRNQLHGLLILDVDNFKEINDSFGHIYGDKTIAEVASLIQSSIRSSDIVGRIGGDEFMILLKNIPDKNFAGQKAEEICCKLHDKGVFELSVSIGIAISPLNGATFLELYQNADKALYESKKNGKNTFTFFHECL